MTTISRTAEPSTTWRARTSTSLADELLTPLEASRFLKVSLSWLAKARLYGTGPVYRKVGRSVRYLRSDLERYLAARVRTSTSQI